MLNVGTTDGQNGLYLFAILVVKTNGLMCMFVPLRVVAYIIHMSVYLDVQTMQETCNFTVYAVIHVHLFLSFL